MTENELREKIERFKIKAEDFLNNNIRAFIVDVNETYYFCDIITVGEAFIYVESFKGVREGQREKIFWADVVRLEGYKEREELK